MNKKNLADICNYLKTIIIPSIPADFTVAEPFRHGLSEDELRRGIESFRSFLYKFYDKIAADKEKFTTSESEEYVLGGSIYKCFPIINDFAIVLYSLGIHSKLESKSQNKLIVSGKELADLEKIKNKRKFELFNYLSESGFYFEGADFSDNNMFLNSELHITYECDDYLVIGLKLIAEAYSNMKKGSCNLIKTFMRCDFYPLANLKPKDQIVYINDFANSQIKEVRDFIKKIDQLMIHGGCRVIGEIHTIRIIGKFSYISQKSKKTVCIIDMGNFGCYISLRGNHFIHPKSANSMNILDELPKEMFEVVKKGVGCGLGFCRNYDYSINNNHHCVHGVAEVFPYKGDMFFKCQYAGYDFVLNKNTNYRMIEKWIEYEIA